MERLCRARAQTTFQTRAQFPRRLVGERHRRNLGGLCAAFKQADDALHQRKRLARARPGDYRQSPGGGIHSAKLLFVQPPRGGRGRFRNRHNGFPGIGAVRFAFAGNADISNMAICPPSISSSPGANKEITPYSPS